MQKLIIANFKSNKSHTSALSWLETVVGRAKTNDLLEKIIVAVAPSYISTASFSWFLSEKKSLLRLAIQDISPFPAGSYTGAVGTQNILDLGVSYAILGHSEQRKYFSETHELVATKTQLCLENGITPVICVDSEYVDAQLSLIAPADLARCVIAYEPLSAIGSGNRADAGQVAQVIAIIKKHAPHSLVLYGGSVTEESVQEYLLIADGVLVAGASLDAEQFLTLLQKAAV